LKELESDEGAPRNRRTQDGDRGRTREGVPARCRVRAPTRRATMPACSQTTLAIASAAAASSRTRLPPVANASPA